MTRGGSNRTSDRAKRAAGTWRRDRAGRPEYLRERLPQGVPRCPRDQPEAIRKLWRATVKELNPAIISPVDRYMLLALVLLRFQVETTLAAGKPVPMWLIKMHRRLTKDFSTGPPCRPRHKETET